MSFVDGVHEVIDMDMQPACHSIHKNVLSYKIN